MFLIGLDADPGSFRTFGALRYARITLDKTTGRSRGSGFACFWKREHADAAIVEAEKVAQETGANAQPVSVTPSERSNLCLILRTSLAARTLSHCPQCSLQTHRLRLRADSYSMGGLWRSVEL